MEHAFIINTDDGKPAGFSLGLVYYLLAHEEESGEDYRKGIHTLIHAQFVAQTN